MCGSSSCAAAGRRARSSSRLRRRAGAPPQRPLPRRAGLGADGGAAEAEPAPKSSPPPSGCSPKRRRRRHRRRRRRRRGSRPVAATPPLRRGGRRRPRAFEWPTSTRLTYELTGNYRGEINGDAQVEWVRVGTHYQVHVDCQPRAPLISRRMTSEGELVGDRLLPSRYDEEHQGRCFAQPRRVTILLGPDEIVLATGDAAWHARPACRMQRASSSSSTAMFTTRPELLQAGGTDRDPARAAQPRRLWIYDVLGRGRHRDAVRPARDPSSEAAPRRSAAATNSRPRSGSRRSCATCRCASASARTPRPSSTSCSRAARRSRRSRRFTLLNPCRRAAMTTNTILTEAARRRPAQDRR